MTLNYINIRNCIADIVLQVFLCGCLFFALTSGALLIGRESYLALAARPALHMTLILATIAVGGLTAFVRYRMDPVSFFDLEPARAVRGFLNLPPVYAVSVVTLIYFVMQFMTLYFLHLGLGTSLWDLGFNENVIWNTAHGSFLTVSVRGGYNVLGEHFYPMLALLAPVFSIGNDTWLLFAVQTAFAACTIPLVYRIACLVGNSKQTAIVIAIGVFFYLPMRSGLLFPFHVETFADPFLLLGFYLALTRRYFTALGAFFIVLLCKENIVMEVGGIALFLISKRRRFGWVLGIFAVVFLAVNTRWIEPLFRFDYNWNKWGYYKHITHPSVAGWIEVAKAVFSWKTFSYLALVLGPFLFLSLCPKGWFWLIGPSLLIRLLTPFPGFRIVTAHYTVGLNALVFISASYGALSGNRRWLNALLESCRVFMKLPQVQDVIRIGLLLAALLFAGIPQLFLFENVLWEATSQKNQGIVKILESIPASYSVRSTQTLLAHLTHRRYIFGYDTFRPDAPMFTVSQNVDLLVSDDFRLQTNEKKVLEDFIARGYRMVFEFGVMKIYARPDLPEGQIEKLTAGWRRDTGYAEISYRKYVRRWYAKVLRVGLVLLGLLLIFRSFRWKKRSVPSLRGD